MRQPTISARRLAGLATLACAAALTPAAALAAAGTAGPATALAAGPASTAGCATAGLVVWMNTQGDGYAGGIAYTLNFTNLSGHACTPDGLPGVSAVSLSGGQVGRAAGWSGHASLVTLASGATATATLLVTNVNTYGAGAHCNPVTAAGLRVYPPGQTASKVIPFPFGACSNAAGPVYLTAGPVT